MGSRLGLGLLALICVGLWIARSADSIRLDGNQKVQLNFWNGFTGPDGRVMLEMIRQFNIENPNIAISMQRIAWATYYNKVMVAAVDGRGPEVFVLQSQMIPRMQRVGILETVNDIYGPSGELKSEFDPKLIKMLDYGKGSEQIIGVPLDTWPMGLYYNAEILKKAGMVNPDGTARPPTNSEEFLAACKLLKQESNGNIDQWGFALTNWQNNYMSLVPQFGGQLIDAEGNPTFELPGNIAALQYLADLLQKHHLIPSPEAGVAGWTGFRQKKVAMVVEGIYMVGDLKRLDGLDYQGAPVPQVGPMPGTFADSHVLCIRKGLPEAQRAAAAKFVRFISDHSVEWADAGQVPARLSARASEKFKLMPVQYAFSKQLGYVMYPPKTPSIGRLMFDINNAIEKAIRGTATAADALHEAQENYSRYLERDRMEQQGVQPATADGAAN